MQMHPAFITTLISEHERSMRERAKRARMRPRRERRARSAPWPP